MVKHILCREGASGISTTRTSAIDFFACAKLCFAPSARRRFSTRLSVRCALVDKVRESTIVLVLLEDSSWRDVPTLAANTQHTDLRFRSRVRIPGSSCWHWKFTSTAISLSPGVVTMSFVLADL